jgi:hypothetical protein
MAFLTTTDVAVFHNIHSLSMQQMPCHKKNGEEYVQRSLRNLEENGWAKEKRTQHSKSSFFAHNPWIN